MNALGHGLLGRRAFIGALFASSTAGASAAETPYGFDGAASMLTPTASSDHTPILARAISAALRRDKVVRLSSGTFRVSGLRLPSGTRLVGLGKPVLIQAGPGPVLTADGADDVAVCGLTIVGGPDASATSPLIAMSQATNLRLTDNCLRQTQGIALRMERCSGYVERNSFEDVGTGILSLNGESLRVSRNQLQRCRNNGIQIWRSTKGYDGSIITENRISGVRAENGGSGENGNGINVFRADGVIASTNVLRDCEFTGIRANASSSIQIIANSVFQCGETAIYVEFGFEGSIVSGNHIDGASVGISITNFNEGGRLGAVSGNIVRRLFRRPDPLTLQTAHGIGIAVEADTVVNGNVVEGAEFAGFALGHGPYLRDVLCCANLARACYVGAAVSVVPGALRVQLANNLFSDCPGGSVVAFEWDKAVSGSLDVSSARRFPNIQLAGSG